MSRAHMCKSQQRASSTGQRLCWRPDDKGHTVYPCLCIELFAAGLLSDTRQRHCCVPRAIGKGFNGVGSSMTTWKALPCTLTAWHMARNGFGSDTFEFGFGCHYLPHFLFEFEYEYVSCRIDLNTNLIYINTKWIDLLYWWVK
jgi:hypothetical protein